MTDGKRFEDKISIKDLMNMPDKELMANIYMQALITNGQVSANKDNITILQEEIKDKIGWKLFKKTAILLTAIISILTIPSVILNIINLVVMGK